MELTINVTDKQAEFLKQFARNQYEGARDNVCTRKPIHLVQSKQYEYIFDEGVAAEEYDGDIVFFEHDSQEYYDTERELIIASGVSENEAVSYADAEGSQINGIYIWNRKDYWEAYGVNAYTVSKTFEWKTKAYFFTLAEAKKYIKYQGHNLTEPRTYTAGGGYGNNGDYEPFWDLLMDIGTKLSEAERVVKNNELP